MPEQASTKIQLTPEQYLSIGVGNHVLIGDCVVSIVQPPSLALEIQKLTRRLYRPESSIASRPLDYVTGDNNA